MTTKWDMQRTSFRLFDPASLRRVSVLEVTHAELFDKRGKPKAGGVFDPHLGTLSRDYHCKTCRLDLTRCPGHIGHVELATPVYHVLTLSVLVKVLQCVCDTCSQPLAPWPTDGRATFTVWNGACKKATTCPNPSCKVHVPKYTASGGVVLRNGEPYAPAAAYRQLTLISEETRACFRHLSVHPRHLLLTVLPIPAPHIHPPVKAGLRRSLDDLTLRYGEIIRCNASIRALSEDDSPDETKLQGLRMQLQGLVTSLFDSDAVVLTTRNTRPFRGISQRIKGKEGRIRGNLTGKRVDFSARSVITGDSTLELHEIGVPEDVAKVLTIPEVVHSRNKHQIDRLMKQGAVKTVTRSNGLVLDLRWSKQRVYVQPGDVVERFLMDGDVVIFNRQPTLHRMSMMAHTVRILPGLTFRMNLSATAPYNADMDGDEMNIHVAQTIEARTEMRELMDVRHHIVSSQAHKPVITFVQDTTLALYLLSSDECWLDRSTAMRCWWAMQGPRSKVHVKSFPAPAIVHPRPLWAGKQILSCSLPPITVTFGDIVIQDGEFLTGRWTKKTLGGNRGLVHCAWQIVGPEACGDMISSFQWLAHEYLSHRGFSIGFSDLALGVEEGPTVRKNVAECLDDVVHTTARAYRKGLTRNDIEPAIVSKLDHARDSSGKHIQERVRTSENSLYDMVTSGSKGSSINVSQICACVGQQHIEGGRPKPTLDGFRCLSHFVTGDPSPKAYGFVDASYLDGLSPTECFFHAQAGREGVIDTACKTKETGYIQRKYVKLLEDLSISYDGTVRDSVGGIYQFEFGGDGIDPTFHVKQTYHGSSYMLPFVIDDLVWRAKQDDTYEIEPETDHWNQHWKTWADAVYRFDAKHAPAILRAADEIWNRTRIVPGTPVGVISAQSLGEVSTQLALNSVTWETEIEVWIDDCPRVTTIGAFVDRYMESGPIVYPDGTEYVSLPADRPIRIESIDDRGIVHKTRIEAVTRHPVRNRDGSDEVVRYVLESGRQVTVTVAKGLLKKVGTKIESVTADEVDVGDYLPVHVPDKPHDAKDRVPDVFLGGSVACIERHVLESLTPKGAGDVVSLPELGTFVLSQEDVACIRDTLAMECIFERVVSKERTRPPDDHPLMYDLTVETTRNFTLHNRICVADSFHTSGTGGSITSGGVPRMRELVNLNRDTNVEVSVTMDRETANSIASSYETVPLLPCIRLIRVASAEERDEAVRWSWRPIPEGTCVKIELHKTKLLGYKVSISDVVSTIARDTIVPFVWGTDISATETSVFVILSNTHHIPLFQTEVKSLWIRASIGGVGAFTYEEETGIARFAHTKLPDVWAIADVDGLSAMSNSIADTYECLGVEAARAVFLREMQAVFTNAGSYLHPHHFSLLADVMFQNGEPKPINRYGVRDDKGVLGRASFETSMQTLVTAGLEGRTDPLSGASERIMTGKRISMGTGCFQIKNTEHKEPVRDIDPEPTVGFVPSSPGRFLDTCMEDDEETAWIPEEDDPSDGEESWIPT